MCLIHDIENFTKVSKVQLISLASGRFVYSLSSLNSKKEEKKIVYIKSLNMYYLNHLGITLVNFINWKVHENDNVANTVF